MERACPSGHRTDLRQAEHLRVEVGDAPISADGRPHPGRQARVAAARPAIAALRELSYAHAPHRPRALWFYKPASAAPADHTCHLHLTEPGSDLWRERLAFRDALRADPQLAARYRELKRQLARSAAGITAYTAGKRAFVAAVLAAAGVPLAGPAG